MSTPQVTYTQKQLSLPPFPRGSHLITDYIVSALSPSSSSSSSSKFFSSGKPKKDGAEKPPPSSAPFHPGPTNPCSFSPSSNSPLSPPIPPPQQANPPPPKKKKKTEPEEGECSIASIKTGLLHLFLQHTSAALSLNENWDEDVRRDMSDALDGLVKEDAVSFLFSLFAPSRGGFFFCSS